MRQNQKTLASIVSLLLTLSFLAGCDPRENASTEESDSRIQGKPQFVPAAGYINGKRWNFKSGRAYHRSRFLIVKLWNMDVNNPCEDTPKTPLQIRLKTISKVGELAIGNDSFKNVPVIFFIDEDRSVNPANPFFNSVEVHANTGKVIIDEISLGPLVIVSGRFEGASTALQIPLTAISGSFQVSLCDENHH